VLYIAWRRRAAALAAAGVMADSDDEFYECDTDIEEGWSFFVFCL